MFVDHFLVDKTPRSRYATYSFSMLALYFFAFSVSLGLAIMSIAKALLVLAFLFKLPSQFKSRQFFTIQRKNYISPAIFLGLIWLFLTWFWSHETGIERFNGLGRHLFLLLIPIIFYLIESKQDAIKVLSFFVLGQIFIVISSYALFAGIPVPWALSEQASQGAVLTSTLEQPIMNTIMLTIVWFLRGEIPAKWRWPFVLALSVPTLINILFFSVGRTGYVTLFFALSVVIYWQLPKKYRLLGTLLAIILIATFLIQSSSRFHTKVKAIGSGIQKYTQGEIMTSEGMRLDFWTKSLDAIKEKPVIGHGVGSWKINYSMRSDFDINNPHQEFLLWAVEGGLIGLILLLSIFIAGYYDSRSLVPAASQALRVVLGITFLSCMANSSLRDPGIREFIFLAIASLLAVRSNDEGRVIADP